MSRIAEVFSRLKAARRPALDVAPTGIDESVLSASSGATLGGSARWVIASSGDGPINVKSALRAKDTDVIAYASGVLHVPTAG